MAAAGIAGLLNSTGSFFQMLEQFSQTPNQALQTAAFRGAAVGLQTETGIAGLLNSTGSFFQMLEQFGQRQSMLGLQS
jgi:hypothetical protein